MDSHHPLFLVRASDLKLRPHFSLTLFSRDIAQNSLEKMAASTNGDQASILDINAHPTAQKLNARCAEFFAEVEDL